jgi:hypothetical protein
VRTLLLIAALGAALGCATAAAGEISSGSLGEAEPTSCTAAEVRELVVTFIRVFNRGDSDELHRVFAREPDFQWYSTDAPGVRLREAAMDRSSLVRYFAKRAARRERLTLRTFRFNGNTQAPKPYGNFVFTLRRQASDLQPTAYNGKGAAHCYAGADEIIVWSMARRSR